MTYSPGPMGNVISRLQGLKNVSRRKVMPGEGILQEKDDYEDDVSGTAQTMPDFAMPVNQEFGNSGIQSQSDDVRANMEINPSKEEDEQGFFSKLGSSLASMVQSKAAGASEMTKGMVNRYGGTHAGTYNPPQKPEQFPQEAGQGFSLPQDPEQSHFSKALGKGLTNLITGKENKPFFPYTENREYIDQPPGYMDEKDPNEPSLGRSMTDMVKGMVDKQGQGNYLQPQPAPPPVEKTPEELEREQKERENAELNPWQVAAYGANDTFANNPELVQTFEQDTGIKYTDQMKDTVDQYEKILSDRENGIIGDQANYDEQAKRINDRINSNQTTDADKFFIGLALAMPLIIGGLFGKEAGLGALSGGAKGIGNMISGRQDAMRKDEALLAGINKQKQDSNLKRSEIDVERLKIPGEVRKANPNPNEDIVGMNIATFKDPNTGEVIASGPEILPGFVADTKYANNAKARDVLRGKASELAQEEASLERANAATAKMVEAAMQIKDPTIFGKLMSYALSDGDSALKKWAKQNAPEIYIDGRWQNSAVLFDSIGEQLKDAYRRNEGMKAFTNTVSGHLSSMLSNPLSSGLKPQDIIDQVLTLRDRGQNFFIDKAKSQGFITIPFEQKFGLSNRNLYSGLNKREEKKLVSQDKQLMHGSE